MLWLLSAQWGETPVPSLIEQVEERQGSDSVASLPPVAARKGKPRQRPYVKRTGLHIDIPWLGGRRLEEIPAEVVADQLGVEISREELPQDEVQVVFEKADLWLYDGRIYRVRKELAHPMDIPTALGTSGYPLDLGVPIDGTDEVRWNRAWNERRMRLLKSETTQGLYEVIDVWRFLPKEQL